MVDCGVKAEDQPCVSAQAVFHSASHPVNLPLSRSPPCQAACTAPSSATSSTTSKPFERRSVSIACCGVCAIGPATLNDVLTDISTPIWRAGALREGGGGGSG